MNRSRSGLLALALVLGACSTTGPNPSDSGPVGSPTSGPPSSTSSTALTVATTTVSALGTTFASSLPSTPSIAPPTTVDAHEADQQLVRAWFDRYNSLVNAKQWDVVAEHLAASSYGPAEMPQRVRCHVGHLAEAGRVSSWLPGEISPAANWVHPELGGVPEGRIYRVAITAVSGGQAVPGQMHATVLDNTVRYFPSLAQAAEAGC